MTGLVSWRRDDDVAVITIDNPPVNALSHPVRAQLLEAVTQAHADPAVGAIVFACAGRTFVAGADISEFGKPPQFPILLDVIARLEQFSKPLVAAVHGTVLGGGLELTLACHFRVADRRTKLGLPEIKLGLIPGAGGTQRLPRLIGMEHAAPIILTGDPIAAPLALEVGLIDEIADGDVLPAAIVFAHRAARAKLAIRRVSEMEQKLAALRGKPDAFAAIVAPWSRAKLDAPKAAIELLRLALTAPFAEAMREERAVFMRLMAGEQSKAQRYLFFAERAAGKHPALKPAEPRNVAQAAIIGAGTMGTGIAMCFANAGIAAVLIDTDADAVARGMTSIEKQYESSVARGRLTADEKMRRLALISTATSLSAAKDADLIVEAVFEELEIKKSVFRELDKIAKPGAVLATNTSYLDVNEIAKATGRPEAVIGLHFFSPANVMRLLEIVNAKATDPAILAAMFALARKLGKVPVIVGICRGFVGNRMLQVRSEAIEQCLLEGALPEEIDAALAEFGFAMGPLAVSDLAGLDISWRMRKANSLRAEIADALCEAGRLGMKNGKGYYRYEAGSRRGVPDPAVKDIIEQASARLGISRRAFSADEIVTRLITPMIEEGRRLLSEGIAHQASDIDLIWVHGYGWPAARGGPMYYADTLKR